MDTFYLEKLCIDHKKAMFDIRNHISVRKNLTNSKPLNYLAHSNWFLKKLLPDKSQVHFLIKHKNKYIGIVLLRNINANSAEVGVLFKNNSSTKWIVTYSTVFISYYAFDILNLKKIYSYVNAKNIEAIKFNKGFSGKKHKTNKKEIYKYTFDCKDVKETAIYKRLVKALPGQLAKKTKKY